MSLYGIAMAAFVSVFVGTDFSDGFIRNKILASDHRSDLVISHIIVSCSGGLLIYMIVTAFSTGIGRFFFENNMDSKVFFKYFLLGIG